MFVPVNSGGRNLNSNNIEQNHINSNNIIHSNNSGIFINSSSNVHNNANMDIFDQPEVLNSSNAVNEILEITKCYDLMQNSSKVIIKSNTLQLSKVSVI
jgi:Fic family protein